jgi:hypothetical protein
LTKWRVVEAPYSLEAQYEWEELPDQEDLAVAVRSCGTTIRQSKTQSPRFWPRRKKAQAAGRWRPYLLQNQR